MLLPLCGIPDSDAFWNVLKYIFIHLYCPPSHRPMMVPHGFICMFCGEVFRWAPGSPQTSAEGGADSTPRSVQIELSGFRELLFSRAVAGSGCTSVPDR